MANNPIKFLNEAMSAPLGNLIASIGEGVGEAQAALDAGSLAQTLAIYDGNDQNANATLQMLKEIGYQPTFYVIPETKVKVKMSLSLTMDGSFSDSPSFPAPRLKSYAMPFNGSNSNKYNLNVNAGVEMEFSIKPIPTAAAAEIRRMPDLVGKTYEIAKQILTNYGLGFELIGDQEILDSTIVISQKLNNVTIEPGTVVNTQSIIQLDFTPNTN